MERYTVEEIRGAYGEKPQVSEWHLVEQEHIDQFGQATLDSDWMHVDPERAKRDGPFGGTVAFGFWTLPVRGVFPHSSAYLTECRLSGLAENAACSSYQLRRYVVVAGATTTSTGSLLAQQRRRTVGHKTSLLSGRCRAG